MNLSTIILAAGKGTRMQSDIPKVLHEVASKPLIWHIINLINILDDKSQDTVVVIGPEMEGLQDYVRVANGAMTCVVQEERLGTADAVKVGLSKVTSDHDVLVIYGDTPFIKPSTIRKMYDLLQINDKTALVILGFVAKDPARHGRLLINQKDELERIVEYLDCSEEQRRINLCNSGIMLINKKYIRGLLSKVQPNNAKNEYYLTDLVEVARQEKLVCRYITVDEFEAVAINTREELARAESIIQHQLRTKFIAQGVTLVDQNTVYFAMDTAIENDVVIEPNVFFGAGVIVKSGTKIKSFCHIEGATIEHNNSIGPFARIRPGTTLGEKVRIGNFVEIKNTTVNSNTKINHLSYIGDAEVGKGVTIGAGTITCNYDGFNKYRSHILDNAFVGSNTIMIAPVTIGEGAIIAAGSVITENVENDSLAVARSKQVNMAGRANLIRSTKIREQGKNKPYL